MTCESLWRGLTALERFENQYIPEPNAGCWLWIGANTGANGYGQFSADKRRFVAHRWSYERFVGPIPNGLTLDHLCKTTCCVNPAHLEPVTNKVNVLRGNSISANNARKTHCKRGHELTGDNLIERRDGRECRACSAMRIRSWQRLNPRAPKFGPRRRAPEKSVCKHGHQLSGENLYVHPKTGRRRCKACHARRQATIDARRRAERQGKNNGSM